MVETAHYYNSSEKCSYSIDSVICHTALPVNSVLAKMVAMSYLHPNLWPYHTFITPFDTVTQCMNTFTNIMDFMQVMQAR